MNEIEYGFCNCGCGKKTKISTYTRTKDDRIKGKPIKFIHGHRIIKQVITNCYICGNQVVCSGKKPNRSSLTAANYGKACCSEKCTEVACSRSHEQSAIKLGEYNRKYASVRMQANNPMHDQTIINKMIETKEKNGTLHNKPINRGGNGKNPPKPQFILAKRLGWEMELPIKTAPNNIPKGQKRAYSFSYGWPTAYKIDIGNSEFKIAIEVDGACHHGKRSILDNKKDSFLESIGWKVLRFQNKDIINNLDKCVSIVMEAISCSS